MSDIFENTDFFPPSPSESDANKVISLFKGIENSEAEERLSLYSEKLEKKYGKARKAAFDAQRVNVSRRLLLAIRSKQLTCVCPISGIVSLLDIPAIPGYALTYKHPIAELQNARGIAQRGLDYLRRLDTQILAGIFIILAEPYELIQFMAFTSGAEKNAVLRTVGKDMLIDAIIIVEEQIHSRNITFLPKLSLAPDVLSLEKNFEKRFHSYLGLLTEAIAKPDKERWDENAAPKKVGRPLYIRDVEKAERKISFLARKEIAVAKKELADDAKTAKILAANLVVAGIAKPGLKSFIAQLMADNGMGLVEADPSLVDMLVNQKICHWEELSSDATELRKILQKNRTILKAETSELDDFLAEEQDDPKPGQEPAIEDFSEANTLTPLPSKEWETPEEAAMDRYDSEENSLEQEIKPPEALSGIAKILWMKKYQASQKKIPSDPKFVAKEIPSTVSYIPIKEEKKQKEEPLNFAGYNADRLFLVYSNSKAPTGVYFTMDDMGNAVLAWTTLPPGDWRI